MTKKKFLKLMSFPEEWLSWEMYPNELAELQIKQYQPGNENSSEHFRFGAFCWWEHNFKCLEDIEKLIRLAELDPDSGMGEHAINRLSCLSNPKGSS